MPTAPLRYCAESGCSEKTSQTRCAAHQQAMRQAHGRNYGRPWRRRRQAFLDEHPEHYWCAECRKQGRKVLSTDVDHIIPHRGNLELRDDDSNLQGLCKPHHTAKTQRETVR